MFSDQMDSPKSNVLNSKIIMSGFGEITLNNPEILNTSSANIYQDTELGFQISKPNAYWEINSALDEISVDELNSLKTKGFLDGVYIEQNHDKRFMLTVFDIKKENFSLNEYIESQISAMNSQKKLTVSSEQVSPENDWAMFAVELPENNGYGEQLMFLKENRLYMLQYFGEHPENLNSDKKKDFQFIMESFEVI